jgi:hypothetical protein
VAGPQLKYKPPGDEARRFMLSTKFVRGIRGPVGSGKSTTCCVEILRKAKEQAPNHAGVRRSRWAVVRNTNPELKTTTIKTWLDLYPEEQWGEFNWSVPYTHRLDFMLEDGTRVDLEVIFLALDRPEDVKKLLSLELTGIWGNEARELPKAVIDGMTMRVGRFPSMREGGPSWYGVILDTNAPDTDHWWPILAGESPVPDYLPPEEQLMLQRPPNWEFFTQPPAMIERVDPSTKRVIGYDDNPAAENFKNLVPGYYANMIQGKTRSWIAIYVLNRLGRDDDGKAVHSGFVEETHVARQQLQPIPKLKIIVGIDFGLTPAAVFGQRSPRGQWLTHRELVTSDMGILRFAELLKSECASAFPDHTLRDFEFYGDPSGDYRSPTDERTPFDILRAAGINCYPAPGDNDPVLRVEAGDATLARMVDGAPGELIDPRCTILIRGLAGGYHYKRLPVAGEARYQDKPDKNRFSHVCEARQYMLLGGGEGRNLKTGGRAQQVRVIQRQSTIFERRGGIMGRRAAGRVRPGSL